MKMKKDEIPEEKDENPTGLKWVEVPFETRTCPNCGFCPTCGRAATPVIPYIQPIPWQPTPWWGTITVSSGTTTTEVPVYN